MKNRVRLGVTALVLGGCFKSAPQLVDDGGEDTDGTTGGTSMTSLTTSSTTWTDTTSADTQTTSSDDPTSSTDTDDCDCAGELEWHMSLPAPSRVSPTADGALLVAGAYGQAIELLGEPLPVDGSGADTFVARIASDETLDWVFRIHSNGAEFPHAVAPSPAGGAFAVSGVWDGGELTIGEHSFTTQQEGRNAYFALFDSNASLVRAEFVRSVVDYFGGLHLTGDHRIVAASGFAGTAIAPAGESFDAVGGRDGFYLTLDQNGLQTVFLPWGGSGDDHVADVAPDGLQPGSSYVVGSFSGTVAFGDHMLTSAGGTDVFVLHVDFVGNIDWAYSAGGPGDDQASTVAVDGQGRPYVLGHFHDTLQYEDGTTLDSEGNADVFVVAIDVQGVHRWSRSCGGSGEDLVRGAATLGGDLFIGGEFAAQADFGAAAPLQSEGGKDAVVASYDSDGTFRWAHTYGGPGDDRVGSLAVGADRVFATLGITGEIDLGDGDLVGTPAAHTGVIVRHHP